MRILHILDHSIPLHSGYAFRTLGILGGQRALGWETFHLTGPKQPWKGADKEEAEGWVFLRTPPVSAPLLGVPVAAELATMRNLGARLSEAVKQVRPDLLHAHSPVLNALPALWVGRRCGLPVVYEVRALWEDAAVSHNTSEPDGIRYRASRLLETFALKRADAVTVICEHLKSEVVSRGVPAEKVTVIPNAVDLRIFSGAAPPDPALVRRYGLEEKIVMGFFGSFYRYEGLHLLLEALPGLTRAIPALRVLLGGGGPEEEALRRLSQKLDIADRITFVGRIPQSDIQNYYNLVDMLIFPRQSLRLTELVTPLKPLEAMAQEKIVIASDVGGHRELIRDNETGFLFRADEREALVATVLKALDRRADWPKMRRRARRFVEKDRSWHRVVSQYKTVYDRLTAT